MPEAAQGEPRQAPGVAAAEHSGATQDERTRIRAYHLWEADGRPQGREEEFWERARELIAIEDNPTAGQLPQSHAGQSDSGPRATG